MMSERENAHELFAHGLLLQHAELQRAGATFRRERRIREIMARLEEPDDPRGDSLTVARRSRVKVITALAAAAIAIAAFVAWPRSRLTPAYADELFERTVAGVENGTHVFKVRLERTKTYWSRRSRRRKTSHQTSTWLVALGPRRQWNVKKLTGNLILSNGVELGSNGKTLWTRSRAGKAFELMIDPKQIEVTTLGPIMSFYQLRPFLETVLSELSLEVAARRRTARGIEVDLEGSYKNATRRRSRRRRHGPPTPDRLRSYFLGTAGHVQVTVDEDSGLLERLRFEQRTPAKSTLEVERQPTPDDLAAAGFEFDPPRVRVPAQHKVWAWLFKVARSMRRGQKEGGR